MPWPKAEEIQSWKDICEKLLGINFNNGTEITSYPITKRENLANPSNRFTLAHYDKDPCDEPIRAGMAVRDCSYGQIFARIYHILMKEYADQPFNQQNLRAFLNHVGPNVQSWLNSHPDTAGSSGLLMVMTRLENRLRLPFTGAEISSPKTGHSQSKLAKKSSEDADTDDQSEDLPRLALGLQDSRDNDLAKILVEHYNTNSTFGSILDSMQQRIWDTVKKMPAPPAAPYINLGVERWLDACLELHWPTDLTVLKHKNVPKSNRDGVSHKNGARHLLGADLFDSRLEDFIKLDFRDVQPTSNVSAYLQSPPTENSRFSFVGGHPATVIPVVVRIDWEELDAAIT